MTLASDLSGGGSAGSGGGSAGSGGGSAGSGGGSAESGGGSAKSGGGGSAKLGGWPSISVVGFALDCDSTSAVSSIGTVSGLITSEAAGRA